MISSTLRPGEQSPPHPVVQRRKPKQQRLLFQLLSWFCLLLACCGASWFAFQVFLVPQPKTFTPDWQNARWLQTNDPKAVVSYFRTTMVFDAPPENAFITIAASQVFRLYVNGVFVGSNTLDFVQGQTQQTYMFDLSASVTVGKNVIGIRVANVDNGHPQLRATIGTMWGNKTKYYPSDTTWQMTSDSALAQPRGAASIYSWSVPAFDASRWPNAQYATTAPTPAPLLMNPLVYTQPMPTHWISDGARLESFYVRQFSVTNSFDNALLRIVATGEAQVFINDHLYAQWNGLVNIPQVNAVTYLSTNGQPAPYRNGLLMGVYDVTPYIHAGTNTIAIHVLAPGSAIAKVGLDSLRSALSADMLVGSGTDYTNYTNPLANDNGWHASSHSVAGWTSASNAVFSWHIPATIGRPGSSHAFYLPDSNTPRNVQVIPASQIAEVCGWSSLGVLVFWLAFSLLMLRRYYPTRKAALAAGSLIWLPALALEITLVVLGRQSSLPQPFPYDWQRTTLLLATVVISASGFWYSLRQQSRQQPVPYQAPPRRVRAPQTRNQQVRYWLQHNWAILPVFLLGLVMVCYQPDYEPYWQDELSSFYAARFIMAHGYPAFISGFVYAKGELFSYLLALFLSIGGTTNPIVPRLISILAYIAGLPILYVTVSRLFNRRIAWLATAMLAFSPYAMTWARQVRMYELAQLMVIIVVATLYWALQYREKIKPVFIAVGTMLIAYFSHEEVFIILPAIILSALGASREGRYGMPSIMRKKHWWLALLLGATVIIIQLSIVFLTHPPKFGSDQSQRPQIAPTLNNISYYYHLLFAPFPPKDGPTPWVVPTPFIAINAYLALLGCVVAFVRKDRRPQYIATFLIVSSLTLACIFTMEADRYYYPLLPLLYTMAAYGFWQVLQFLWHIMRPLLALMNRQRQPGSSLPWMVRVGTGMTAGLLCASVLLIPMLPLSNSNLFLNRIMGTPYHHHFADYDNATQYIKDHEQPGDFVIAASPAVIANYYLGHVDAYFSVDRALFLFEKGDGKIIETTTGSHALLNQADFQTELAMHKRIWLISDNGGYQGGVTKNARFNFPPPDFRTVYEGYGSAVYFRSTGN